MNNGLAKAGFALGTAALATPAGWLLVLGGCLIAAAVDAVSEQQ